MKARKKAAQPAVPQHPVILSDKDFRKAAKLLRAKAPQLSACMDAPIKLRLKPDQPLYATLLESIVHQQLSVKAAATIVGRIKLLYAHQDLPEPQELLDTPDASLRSAGLSRSKAKALKDLATKTLDGTVPTTEQIRFLSDDEIVERLSSIYGIGRWTVEMLLIFNLGRADVWPVDDYGIRRGLALVLGLEEIPTPKQTRELGEGWKPHRTVASLYIWSHLNNMGD